MSSNSFGKIFRVTTFGESHGPFIGAVIDGVPSGMLLDQAEIQRQLARRRPGQSEVSTKRQETDRAEVISGIIDNQTTGAPLALLIANENMQPADYEQLKEIFRPGHADFTWQKKYGLRDYRGGGRSSGRETAARVAAGAVARQILKGIGVEIVGYVTRIASIRAETFDQQQIEHNSVRCADAEAAQKMIAAIKQAKEEGDSVGGVVEVKATGVRAGWGDPVFEKLDAQLAFALMSIGSVKGVEIGDGFAHADYRGSQSNDEISPEGFITNHCGGILGGISTGEPIICRLAVKPTPSIAKEQKTIDLRGQATTIAVPGRHDPCIAPRLVPVAEAMVALVLVDAYLQQ